MSIALTWDEVASVIGLAASRDHHIAGTQYTYTHGWHLRDIGGGKKELHDQLPTADKMSKAALAAHMSLHHASGIHAGGRRSGPKSPSKEYLLAVHEAMHAAAPLSINPPGSADISALKGGYSRISQAHTHGNTTGMANGPGGITLSTQAFGFAAAAVPGQTVTPTSTTAGSASAQPRVAAGSPAGGQFAAASSSGSKAKAPAKPLDAHQKHVAHLQHLATHGTPAQQKAAAALLARMGVKAS